MGDCGICPVGTYRAVNTPGACKICGAGKYADTAGSSECQQCPTDKVITDPGTDPSLHNNVGLCADCPADQLPKSDGTGCEDPAPPRASLPWVKTCDTGWVPGNCEGGATQKITFDPGFTRKQCIQECKREVGMGKTEVYCCSSDWRTKGVADASSECILSKGVGGCC